MNSQSIAELTAQYEAKHGPIETIPKQVSVNNYGFNNKPVNGNLKVLRKTAKTQKVLAHIEANPNDHAALIAVATGVSCDRVRYVAKSNGIDLPRPVPVPKQQPTPQTDAVIGFIKANDVRNLTVAKIAELADVSETCARAAIKALNINVKEARRGRIPAAAERVISAASENLNSYQIAKIANCTSDYARRIMRERGIKYMSARK